MPDSEVALALGCLLGKVFGGFGRFWRVWRVLEGFGSTNGASISLIALILGGA